MEIQYYGGNCIKITSKKTTIVIDDNIKSLGGNSVAMPTDIQLFTEKLKNSVKSESIVIDGPGEYEASDISIVGIAARAHIDEEGKHNATIYKIEADDIKVAIVGHIYPDLTEKQLEDINTTDILLVPVGGHGYTLDTVGAQKVIKQIEPKIIIPTQYDVKGLNYEVPAISLEEAIKGLAMEPKEKTTKLKIKNTDLISEQVQLIILETSSN